MTPLLIKKISLREIFSTHPVPQNFLHQYLKERPGILDNPDIFYQNYRSDNLPAEHKNFSLFKDTNEDLPETIYFCPVYLELFEYTNISPLNLIRELSERYKPNRVVFQWNHDIDFASKYLGVEKYDNVYIINFNTSKPIKNDILAPFWVINTTLVRSIKLDFACLVASLNNSIRRALAATISDRPDYHFISKLPYLEYMKKISEYKFSLCPRGVGLNSYRFYECFHLDTIPVLFADIAALPYDINYDDICVRIPESQVTNFQYINDKLLSTNQTKIKANIGAIRERFTLKGLQEEIHRRLS